MKLGLILKIILAGIFAAQSYSKLGGVNKELYAKWGIEGNMLIAFGILEAVLALAIFTRFSHIVTLVMFGVLLGAFYTVIQYQEPFSRFVMPTIALICILLYSAKFWMEKVGL